MEEVDQLNWPVDQAQELTQMLDMLASIFATDYTDRAGPGLRDLLQHGPDELFRTHP